LGGIKVGRNVVYFSKNGCFIFAKIKKMFFQKQSISGCFSKNKKNVLIFDP
jgi:hypothetical protein